MEKQMEIPDYFLEEVALATTKLKALYLKDENSKKFVQHLIGAFIPVDPMSKVYDNPQKMYDAITGLQLATIKEASEKMTEFSIRKMFIDARVNVEGRLAYNAEEKAELENILKNMPSMIKKNRMAFGSDTSDKHISEATAAALITFAGDLLMFGDKTVENILTKKRMANTPTMVISDRHSSSSFTDNTQSTQRPTKIVSSHDKNQKHLEASLDNCIDDSSFAKLKALKSKLEENE